MTGPRDDVPSALLRIGTRAALRPLLARLAPHGPQLAVLRAVIGGAACVAAGPARHRVLQVAEPVPGEWTLPAGPRDGRPPPAGHPDGVLLYLHGGGYIAGSPRSSRAVTTGLAQLTGLPVFAAAYRRAPEHPFPAALDDCLAVVGWFRSAGVPSSRIGVAGDSAGAHLAVSLVAELLRTGHSAPAALALFSPLLEPGRTGATERDRRHPDPLIPPEFVRRCVQAYLAGTEPGDPRIRVLATDDRILSAFPPTLSQCGSTEAFRDDARLLHERLASLGRDTAHHVVPGQVHGFVTLNRLLKPSRHAMREAAGFLRNAVDPDPREDTMERISLFGLAGQRGGAGRPGQPRRSRRGTRYPLVPADDGFLRRARIRATRSIDLDVYPQELWACLIADDAVVSWSRAVTRTRWISPPEKGVGAVREVTLGGVLTLRERFFRWEEPYRKTFSVTEANRPGLRSFAEDYLVEPTPTGARLTWTVALEPARGGQLVAPVLRLILRLSLTSMLHGLRRRVYTTAPGHPGPGHPGGAPPEVRDHLR